MNFHGLRYVSERCELGEQREALLAVTIRKREGSFLKFCQLLGTFGNGVQLPLCRCERCLHFVGVRLSRGVEERRDPQPAA